MNDEKQVIGTEPITIQTDYRPILDPSVCLLCVFAVKTNLNSTQNLMPDRSFKGLIFQGLNTSFKGLISKISFSRSRSVFQLAVGTAVAEGHFQRVFL
jgi:hypothetical protein